jgi:VanZ family protein
MKVYRRRLWLPVFVMAGVTVLSGGAGPATGGVSFPGMDKIGHFVVFGMLAVAWARSFYGGLGKPAVCLISVLLTTLFGYMDELHQYTNPLRLFEWYDLLADFLGAVAGALVYVYWNWVRRLLEWSPLHTEEK